MPKSVPPGPWNVSFRRWLGAVIADADAAVADGADPFVTGSRGAYAKATAPASAVAGGASARATTGWADGGVGGRRIFSRAAAYTEATTPHCAHLSRSTAGALQRGHVAAITSPAAAQASRRAPAVERHGPHQLSGRLVDRPAQRTHHRLAHGAVVPAPGFGRREEHIRRQFLVLEPAVRVQRRRHVRLAQSSIRPRPDLRDPVLDLARPEPLLGRPRPGH